MKQCRSRRVTPVAGLVALLAACAGGPGVQGPPPRPGEEVTTWVRMEAGFAGQTIYFRNNMDVPVLIEAVEIYDCMNVGRSGCQYFTPNLLLPARSIADFMTLIPADQNRSYRFQYRYNYRAAPELVEEAGE